MTDLSSLISRVEEGEGADRELDASVWYAVVEKPPHSWAVDRDMVGKWPAYSSSLDDVVSLIEQKLPEFSFVSAPDFLAGSIDEMMERGWFPSKPNIPQICRAVLASYLRALENSPAGLADAHKKDRP